MANTFTDAEKATIVEMMRGMTIDGLALHLDSVDVSISTAIDTKIKNAIVSWDDIEEKFVRIRPNLANRGVVLDYDNRRAAIRRKIGKWLQMRPDVYGDGGLSRG